MAAQGIQVKTLASIENSLNAWLKPAIFGENWDNVGILVGSGKYAKEEKIIDNILLCNDLMPAVLDEAIEKKADLIIAYHPIIFSGMKTIGFETWKVCITDYCVDVLYLKKI